MRAVLVGFVAAVGLVVAEPGSRSLMNQYERPPGPVAAAKATAKLQLYLFMYPLSQPAAWTGTRPLWAAYQTSTDSNAGSSARDPGSARGPALARCQAQTSRVFSRGTLLGAKLPG